MGEEVGNTKKSTIEFEIKGSLVDVIFSEDINNLAMGLSTGQENVIKFYTQLKSGTNPLIVDGNEILTQFNKDYEEIKGDENGLKNYLNDNVTYKKNTEEPTNNNKFHPYTIKVSVTPEGKSEKETLIINNNHLKETGGEAAGGGGKTRKGGRKHKRKQRKSAKRKSSRKRKTK